MNLIFKNFSQNIKIKFNPEDIICEAAFGTSNESDIISFINNLSKSDREEAIKELREALKNNYSDDSDMSIGASIVAKALEKV